MIHNLKPKIIKLPICDNEPPPTLKEKAYADHGRSWWYSNGKSFKIIALGLPGTSYIWSKSTASLLMVKMCGHLHDIACVSFIYFLYLPSSRHEGLETWLVARLETHASVSYFGSITRDPTCNTAWTYSEILKHSSAVIWQSIVKSIKHLSACPKEPPHKGKGIANVRLVSLH